MRKSAQRNLTVVSTENKKVPTDSEGLSSVSPCYCVFFLNLKFKKIYIYMYTGVFLFFFLKTASDLFIFSNAKCLRASFLQAATPEQRSGKAWLSTRPGGKQIQVTEAAGKVSSRQGTAIVAPSYRCLSYRFSCSNVVIQSTIANANKK